LLALVELAEHAIEHDLAVPDGRVQRRPQLVRHVREELALVAARDLERAALLLDLVEETHVLDRDRRLIREGLNDLDLAFIEWPNRHPAQDDGPEDPALPLHWHPQPGSGLCAFDDRRPVI